MNDRRRPTRMILDYASRRGEFTTEELLRDHPELDEAEAKQELMLLAQKDELRCRSKTGAHGITEQIYSSASVVAARNRYSLPDQFEFREVLDTSGASGVVLLVFHKLRQKPQVLKLLKAGADPDAFVNEIKLAAERVKHPSIMPVIEAGLTSQGEPYYTMPFEEGARDLARLLRSDGPLPPDRAGRLALQVAEGLAAAHAQGVVHRDVKPENILVTREDDRAIILDLGIAKDLASARTSRVTRQGAVQGTLYYMAPERFDPGRGSPAVDVFALGATLYEMMTGRTPFEAPEGQAERNTTEAVIERIRGASLGLNGHEAAAIPQELRGIIARCIRKDPAERYADGAQLAIALRRFLGENSEASPTGGLASSSGPRRASSSVLAAATFAILAVAAAVLAFLLQRGGGADGSAAGDPAVKSPPSFKEPPLAEPRRPEAGGPTSPDLPKDNPLPPPKTPTHSEQLAALRTDLNADPLKNAPSVLARVDEIIQRHGETDESVLLLRARCLYLLDDLPAARDSLAKLKSSTQSAEAAQLLAVVALRMNELTTSLAALNDAKVAPGIPFFELADACYRVDELAGAQKVVDLVRLAQAVRRLDKLLPELAELSPPDDRLQAVALHHKAIALRRFGAVEEACTLHARASSIDPSSFRASLTTPALDLAELTAQAAKAFEGDDTKPAAGLLSIRDVLPEGFLEARFARLQAELDLMGKYLAGDYEAVLKAHVGKPLEEAPVPLIKTASQVYSRARWEPVPFDENDWRQPAIPQRDAWMFRITQEEILLESHADVDARLRTKEPLARFGFEIDLTVAPADDQGIGFIVLKQQQQQPPPQTSEGGKGRTTFLRFGSSRVDLVERSGAADTKLFAAAPAEEAGRYVAAAIRAGGAVVVYVNRRVLCVLDETRIELPTDIYFGALKAKVSVHALRIIR